MSEHPGWVYFIRAGDAVKIGWSADPWRRIREIRTSSSSPAYMLGMARGSKDLERKFHHWFEAQRTHGEWFSATPNLLRAIPWFCDEFEQQEARLNERLHLWLQVAEEAFHEIVLLAPQRGDDTGGLFRDILDAMEAAVVVAANASSQAADRQAETRRKFGPFAVRSLDPPCRPGAVAIGAHMADMRERAAVKEEMAARPAYLDIRAIFDEEFADEVAA